MFYRIEEVKRNAKIKGKLMRKIKIFFLAVILSTANMMFAYKVRDLLKAFVKGNFKTAETILAEQKSLVNETFGGKTIFEFVYPSIVKEEEKKTVDTWLQMLDLFFKNGLDPNKKKKFALFPLGHVLDKIKDIYYKKKAMPILSLLIKYGADVNKKDSDGLIPLNRCEYLDLVKMLVKDGNANVNKKNWYGETPLEYALIQDRGDVAKFLEENDAQKRSDTYVEPKRELSRITGKIDKDALKNLLEKNKRVSYEDGDSFADKALKYAIKLSAGFDFVDIILQYGAKPGKVIDRVLEFDDYIASLFVRLFLRYGLDGKKIIEKVIEEEKLEVLKVLKEAKIETPKRLKERATALMKKVKRLHPVVHHIKMGDELKKILAKIEKRGKAVEPSVVKKIVKEKKKVAPEKVIAPGDGKKFTQIEAHLNVWFGLDKKPENYDLYIRNILEKYYKIPSQDIPLYVDLINKMNKKSKVFSDHYAFYHGRDHGWMLVLDILSAIRKWFRLKFDKKVYLRVISTVEQKTIEAFRDHWKETYDWSFTDKALSVNVSPFGNTGWRGEGTFYYFLSDIRALEFDFEKVAKLLQDFFFDKKYIKKISELYRFYIKSSKAANMIQILIPRDKVDAYVYMSREHGQYLRKKIYSLEYDKKEKKHKGILGYVKRYTTDPFSIIYEDEYNDLIKKHSEEGWKKAYKMKLKKEKPEKSLINYVQARIVLLPGFFDDAVVQVYNLASEKSKKEYEKKRDKVIDAMMSEWVAKEGYEKLKKDKKNMPLVQFLRSIKWGEKFKKIKEEIRELKKAKKTTLEELLVYKFEYFDNVSKLLKEKKKGKYLDALKKYEKIEEIYNLKEKGFLDAEIKKKQKELKKIESQLIGLTKKPKKKKLKK